jgi:hypothetical protein
MRIAEPATSCNTAGKTSTEKKKAKEWFKITAVRDLILTEACPTIQLDEI